MFQRRQARYMLACIVQDMEDWKGESDDLIVSRIYQQNALDGLDILIQIFPMLPVTNSEKLGNAFEYVLQVQASVEHAIDNTEIDSMMNRLRIVNEDL